MPRLRVVSLALLAACGSQSSSSTGNVGFGGSQDIGEFRGILDAGGIPAPNTLDPNGFFNEHYTGTPPADCGHTICLVPGMAAGFDWVDGGKQDTLVVAMTSPLDPSTFTRKPLDLVVVVDHSGSMAQDDRLVKVKAGLSTLIDNLQATDRLAIVAFDDRVALLSPFAPIDQPLARANLHAVVDNLRPGGGTDIFDGLDTGFAQFPLEPTLERQRRVIFLSDGNATAGDTLSADILGMADQHVASGVGLTTIGVGADFDVDLMRGLAEHGAGNFYFLEDATAATEVFAQELDYFTTPIATNLSFTATAGSGFTFTSGVGSHLWTDGGSRGGSFAAPAAFLASRTSSSQEPGRRGGGGAVFIGLVPNGASASDPLISHFELSYRDAMSGQLVNQVVDLADGTGFGSETPDQPYLTSDDMARRYAMYNMYLGFARATAESPACATATLQALRAHATAWLATRTDPDLTADVALVDEYLANLAAAAPDADPASCDLANPEPYSTGYDNTPMACNAAGGGSPVGWLSVVLAMLYTTTCSIRRSTRRGAKR